MNISKDIREKSGGNHAVYLLYSYIMNTKLIVVVSADWLLIVVGVELNSP